MNQAGVAALNTVRAAWRNVEHPGKNDLLQYWTWCDNIEAVFKLAIDASDEDDEEDITRWKNMKIVIEEPIDSCSYTRQWNEWASRYDWVVEFNMKESAKNERRERARKCDEEIRKIEQRVRDKKAAEAKKAEEEKKARIEAYWEAHAEEKAALESEKKELAEKRDTLQKELDEINSEIRDIEKAKTEPVPSETEKSKIEDQIGDLEYKKARLGMFAGKEKKQIAEEVASLQGRVESLKGKIVEEKNERSAEIEKKLAPAKARKSELDSELAPITKRISAIDAELTKDPEE